MLHKIPSDSISKFVVFFFFFFFFIFNKSQAAASSSSVLISGDATLMSPNRTFELGFFSLDGGSTFFLGIWYASIPIRTYVWLANRLRPIPGTLTPATLSLSPSSGQLAVTDSAGTVIWSSDNPIPSAAARLLDTGNLVLLTPAGDAAAWQSFDSPADTWLPNMTVTNLRRLISWRGPSDPSPGRYSLRLRPPGFGEFELVFNDSIRYWSSGNWTGTRFAGVPEMTVPYIYDFRFENPFTPDAEFVYSETGAVTPVLSRFVVDWSGRILQYTWSEQAASWNMFWSRPESVCRVYGRCGSLGVCVEGSFRACECLEGLRPVDVEAWESGDYSAGCARDNVAGSNVASSNDDDDVFENAGTLDFDGALTVSVPAVGSREECEKSCRRNSSCFGFRYDLQSKLCVGLYGNAFNIRNSTVSPILYLRVSPSGGGDWKWKTAVLIGCVCGFLAMILVLAGLIVMLLRFRRSKKENRGNDEEEKEEGVGILKVFTYKELSAATRCFSEKLGHGGFGAVFRGELPDSTAVAVKRLERPNGGDREFRAEVRTIGNIHHVNLVRLRGFCSEDPHRLLVYDCMSNGPLSAYLTHRHSSEGGSPLLSWQHRFRIAVGTARAIAYLHEECRDCIIHCDIKPENILLDDDFNPKVSDFGLAKLVGRDFSRVLATMRGTWGYVAPEWISGVAITAKADVYSYGMTLLEIIGGRRNVVEATQAQAAEGGGWYYPAWAARRIVEGKSAAAVDPGLGEGEYEAGEAERAGKTAVWCIQDEEGERPGMGEVVKMLEGDVEVRTPPLPRLLEALVSGDSFARARIASTSNATSHESQTVD